MNSLQMIFKYWYLSRRDFWFALILQLSSIVCALMPPIFIGKLVGSLDPNRSTLPTSSELVMYFVLIIIFAFCAFLLGRFGRLRSAEVSSKAVYYLRNDINAALSVQSFAFFDKVETGQLIARATSDVDQTQMIFGFGLAAGIQSIIQVTGVMISASILDIRLAWVLYLGIPISLLMSIIITRKLSPIFLRTREAFGNLLTTFRENILGASVIRIFSTYKKEQKKFQRNNDVFFRTSVESIKYNTLFMPINMTIIGFMIISVIFFGGNLIIAEEMKLDTLITMLSYIGLTVFPMTIWGQILLFYIQGDAALIRIREVLESKTDIFDPPNALSVTRFRGDVEFDHVTFGYLPSTPILQDLSFKIKAGERLAILGTTGSGKSTIINLLPRFYDVNAGEIRIDNVDIRRYSLKEFRKNIGIVSQDTYLFDKSVAENIAYGKENATMEEITQAAEVAQLHEFIQSLPEGYNTMIGERGTRLSGGQKQRLSIARALLIRPSILILDDSTSSVDVETEYHLQQALTQIMKDTTTLIITQRVSTIRNVSKILVLDKGRGVGFGTHEELLQSNVLYRQIFETLQSKQSSSLKVSGGISHE